MDAVAKLKNSANSPRKMRLLANIVRGLPVDQALYILKNHPKKAHSRELEKLLLSAIANWQEKNEDKPIEGSDLFVKEIRVDGARMLKRIQPAPQGRAHRVRKRFSHVTMIISSPHDIADEELEETEVGMEETEEIEETGTEVQEEEKQ